jgi:transcriptional regulator with XRE-family HTH domain
MQTLFVWLTSHMMLTVTTVDAKTIYSELGSVIRRRRKAIGRTQADLARSIGLARASIANIECGRQKILLHQLYQLASALQIGIVELLPLSRDIAQASSEGRDLPFPADLSPKQREQLSKLLHTPMQTKLDNKKE